VNVSMTQFEPSKPTPWRGRYARVMGDASVFHLQYVGGRLWPILLWSTDDGVLACRAIASESVEDLAEAVAQAKRQGGGSGGGAFLINEFGQVIVPSSTANGKRFIAGRIHEIPTFENPVAPKTPINLGKHDHLDTGDPWQLPYIGMPYNLHRNGTIYFYHEDEFGGRSTYPAQQDLELIDAIRTVRPFGPVRLLVNPAGLVLTKVPVNGPSRPDPQWQPVFVGTINPNCWFEKE
jgi:hypothetical protein